MSASGDTLYSFRCRNFLGAYRHSQLWPNEWRANTGWNLGDLDHFTAPAPIRFHCGFPTPGGPYRWVPIRPAHWAMFSYGPDRKHYVQHNDPGKTKKTATNWIGSYGGRQTAVRGWTNLYDPTNGTVSQGFIFRLSGGRNG